MKKPAVHKLLAVSVLVTLLTLWSAAQAQIQVYQDGSRVGTASNTVNCIGAARCTVSSNALRVAVDAGAASSTSGPSWQSVYYCDFTSLSNQNLDAGCHNANENGPFAICSGLSMYGTNQWNTQVRDGGSAGENCSSHIATGASGGLIQYPQQNTAWTPTSQTAPSFFFTIGALNDLGAAIKPHTPIRITSDASVVNSTVNVDAYIFGIYSKGAPNAVSSGNPCTSALLRGFRSALGAPSWNTMIWCSSSANYESQARNPASTAAADIGVITFYSGYGGNFVGQYGNGTTDYALGTIQNLTSGSSMDFPDGGYSARVFMGAGRNGGINNAFHVKTRSIRVEAFK